VIARQIVTQPIPQREDALVVARGAHERQSRRHGEEVGGVDAGMPDVRSKAHGSARIEEARAERAAVAGQARQLGVGFVA